MLYEVITQEWQGKGFTKHQLVEICELGSVTGLCGANCYHSYFPFIPGVSERTYTDEQLDDMNAKENIKREHAGKEYNAYEATQYQRKMETLMRKQRQDIKLLVITSYSIHYTKLYEYRKHVICL